MDATKVGAVQQLQNYTCLLIHWEVYAWNEYSAQCSGSAQRVHLAQKELKQSRLS